MSADPAPPTVWGRVALAVAAVSLTAVAAWVRRPWLALGLTSDEVANVVPGGFMDVWNDPETAVNPPLLRWWMQLGGEAWGPELGRGLAVATGLLAVPLATRLGAANGSVLGGIVAGLLVAAHPLHAMVSAEARAYAPWAALVLVHAWAIGEVLRDGWTRRGAAVVAAVTAMLLPWTHFMAAPMVAASALVVFATPGRRSALALFVPAALAASPLVPWVLAGSSRRTPPMETLEHVASLSVGLGLSPPIELAAPFAEWWRTYTASEPIWPQVMTGSMVGLMTLALLLFRRLVPAQRVLWLQAVALIASLVAVATFQNVRPPTVAVVVVAVGPVLGGLVGAVPWWSRAALALGMVAWFGGELPAISRDIFAVRAEADRVPGVARLLRERAIPGPEVHVWPSWQIPNLFYTATRVSVAHAHVPPVCGARRPCVGVADVALVGVLDVVDGADLRGILVATDIVRDPRLGAACERLDLAPDVLAWSCGGGAGADDAEDDPPAGARDGAASGGASASDDAAPGAGAGVIPTDAAAAPAEGAGAGADEVR